MTDQFFRTTLRDLALELTADDQPGTGVARAWRDGAARARRGRLVVVGSATAVAAVTGVVVLHDSDGTSHPVGPVPSSSGPSPSALHLPGGTRPDGTFHGTRVFWGPTVKQETRLPVLSEGRSALPDDIDLSGAAGQGPIDRAVAAFGLGNADDTRLEAVRLLAEDGTWRDLDVSDLEPVADNGGNAFLPLRATSLSPAGTRLALVQPDRVLVYDLASQEWSSFARKGVESVSWEDDDHLLIPGTPGVESDVVTLDGHVTSTFTPSSAMPAQQAYGPKVPGWIESVGGYYEDAQSYYSIEGVPVPAGTISTPEVASVSVGDDQPVLLVWPDTPGDRAKGCCPPATWLPSGEVVFNAGNRLLSWKPGTHDFHRVSSIVGTPPGSFVIASWADLSH